ncbi:AMP-binding protein [Isoptericola sp. b490]|uniref:AMP-binding protein n=1 Tax=Actinotalea lenta TaxID=3064654 RepID=UPI00271411DB|nr:AMP-binding protein [Isoptericola sp. b490]MDO8122513.1 AMP-binding protein [Isoptericola sp. b490]
MHRLVPWPVAGRTAVDLVRAVAAALDGSGPALAPHAGGVTPALPADVPDGVAAVLATSGSTGRPRGVLLDAAALVASATATHDRLGGPGRWVLALPPEHVAGLQVVVRSTLAGVEPVLADPRDIGTVAMAAREGRVRYAALVPTQLHRAIAGVRDRLPADLAALAGLEAILVGGAAVPPTLLEHGRALGLRLVTTYGSTETSGGCVYDGVPLDGVRVELVDDVVRVAGPTLARGYTEPTADAFVEHDLRRWFVTSDLGRWTADGRLEVLGRRDDVLVVGGTNVAPQAVERALATLPEIGEVCVVGVPDERWGHVPVAVVVARAPTDLQRARDVAVRTLGSAAAPRRLVEVAALPMRPSGKVDRAAVARLVTDEEE